MAAACLLETGDDIASRVFEFVAYRQFESVRAVSRGTRGALEALGGSWKRLAECLSSSSSSALPKSREATEALAAREAFIRRGARVARYFRQGPLVREVPRGGARLASDGRLVVAVDARGRAGVFEGEEWRQLPGSAPSAVNDVCVAADVLTAGIDGVSRSHDLETFAVARELTRGRGPAWGLATVGSLAAVGGFGGVSLVDRRAPGVVQALEVEAHACARAVDLRGPLVAAGVTSGFAYIFDARIGARVLAARHLETSWKSSEVRACAFVDAGLLTACYDGAVRLWPKHLSGRAASSSDATLVADHAPRSVEALAIVDADCCVSVDWAGVLAVSRYRSPPRVARAARHCGGGGGGGSAANPTAFARFDHKCGLRYCRARDLKDVVDPPRPVVTALSHCPHVLALALSAPGLLATLPFFAPRDYGSI